MFRRSPFYILQVVINGYSGLADHIKLRQCEKLCKNELKHNTNFNAFTSLDKVWPGWKTASQQYQAYVYFLLDSRNADDIFSHSQISYVGESRKDERIDQHDQKCNCTLKKGDLFDRKESRMGKIHPAKTLLPNSVNACAIAGSLTEKVFKLKMTSDD